MTLLAALVIERVDEPLECIKVLLILRHQSAWISTRLIHASHPCPLLSVEVKIFTVVYHEVLVVAPANDVDVAVAEGVVRGKACPTDEYVLLFGHPFTYQVEFENIVDRDPLVSHRSRNHK